MAGRVRLQQVLMNLMLNGIEAMRDGERELAIKAEELESGMGLRISRSIVESHRGRLWVADTAPHGATFYFTPPTPVEAHE